jgi:hypothetical protein
MIASSLVGTGLGCGLTFFRFVDPQHDFFPDRVRLQDDVEPFPVIVRESGSNVEPVIILLRSRDDRAGTSLACSATVHLPFV